MAKSADAFRTISEVADELGIPKHVLRFWELRFPQIRPMKRGGGRRYYRPTDVELLQGIRHLLHAEGYTIKGVQKILREQGIEAVKVASAAAGALAAAAALAKPKSRARTAAKPLRAGPPPEPLSAEQRRVVQQVVGELAEVRRSLKASLGGSVASTKPRPLVKKTARRKSAG